MFNKASFVVIIVEMILEYILAFIAKIIYYVYAYQIGKTFSLALSR